MASEESVTSEYRADTAAQPRDDIIIEVIEEDSVDEDEPQKLSYHWPELQLNIWILVLSTAATGTIGIFATLIRSQMKMGLDVPWYMALGIASGSLSVIYIVMSVILAQRRYLLPGVIILLAVLLIPMWVTGLVATSIALWGSQDGVNARCNRNLQALSTGGHDIYTLLWLQENSICELWVAVFSLQLVGFLFSAWIITISLSVYKASRKTPFHKDILHHGWHGAVSIWQKLKTLLAELWGEKSENAGVGNVLA